MTADTMRPPLSTLAVHSACSREEQEALISRGEELFLDGNITEAETLFETLLRENPLDTEILNNLGVIAVHRNNPAEALNYFTQSLEIDPLHKDSLLNCANLLKNLQRTEELSQILQVACTHFPDDPEFAGFRETSSNETSLKEISHTPRPLRIGYVSIWFERGQSYVTKTLLDVMTGVHETFLFARTGGVFGQPMLETGGNWDIPNMTTYPQYQISPETLVQWVHKNSLDVVILNEEYDWTLVKALKDSGVKVVTYLDYYKEDWRPYMGLYDAVLCSTHRTYSLVKDLCAAHYVGWGIDTDLFRPRGKGTHTFFHNAGWLGINYRKMTPAAILAFDALSTHLQDITLYVHAQAELEKLPPEIVRIVQNNPRITYRVETIPAPGLYHKGQILLFPSKLEGLGLPLLEGLASGLPVIAADAPPMNEFVRSGYNGLLVRVARQVEREDNIAFPERLVDLNDLTAIMETLAESDTYVTTMGRNARHFAESELSLDKFQGRIQKVIHALFPSHSLPQGDPLPSPQVGEKIQKRMSVQHSMEDIPRPFPTRDEKAPVSPQKEAFAVPRAGRQIDIASLSFSGTWAKRSWCLAHRGMIQELQAHAHLKMTSVAFWAYPYLLASIRERPGSRVLLLGTDSDAFSSILEAEGHPVLTVPVEDDRGTGEGASPFYTPELPDLSRFEESSWDVVCTLGLFRSSSSPTHEKRKDDPQDITSKQQAILEVARLIKPGGWLLITHAHYLDYPVEMNLSWRRMAELEGIDLCDLTDLRDVYIHDDPLRRGRQLPWAIRIEKPLEEH